MDNLTQRLEKRFQFLQDRISQLEQELADVVSTSSEHDKALTDLLKYGQSYMQDGRHIPLDDVIQQAEAEPVGHLHVSNNGHTAQLFYKDQSLPDGEHPVYTAPPTPVESVVPDVDELAQFIRATDGDHNMGAGRLAESIVGWLSAAQEES